jgi:hypothetical protein
MINRREFVMTGGAFALAATQLNGFTAQIPERETMQTNNSNAFWPDGARLVISISMQMEAGWPE